MMSDGHQESDSRMIRFPGADTVSLPEKNSLAEIYDESRQVAFRVGLPIIGDKISPLNRRINEGGVDELVEAADTIYLASCARQVIRETARHEEAYNRSMAASSGVPGLLSGNAQLEQMRLERDAAMSSLLGIRERIAKIRRLEAMAERMNCVVERPATGMKRRSGAV